MEKIIVSCLESRVEANRNIYARFLLGPFTEDHAVTIATALRRALLSKVKGTAITAIHIQGISHEFSTIAGVRESVLDLALNFQQVVLRTQTNRSEKTFYTHKKVSKRSPNAQLQPLRKFVPIELLSKRTFARDKNRVQDKAKGVTEAKRESLPEGVQIGYLQVQGPAIIYANDLKLPLGVECVDPTQYIATLSTEGLLVVKFMIGKKKAVLNNNNNTLTSKKFNARIGLQSTRSIEFMAKRRSIEGKRTIKVDLNKVSPQQRVVSVHPFALTNHFRTFDSTICLRNTIFLDPIFNSVFQANYIIEKDDLSNQPRERIVLEFWTNGSIHPRQAIHQALLSLVSTFSIFRKVFHLDSW